jgi:hypothetical protein
MSFFVQSAGFFVIALLVGVILLRAMSRAGRWQRQNNVSCAGDSCVRAVCAVSPTAERGSFPEASLGRRKPKLTKAATCRRGCPNVRAACGISAFASGKDRVEKR